MYVDLNDVIEAIEFENELLTHYYNKRTGVIIYKEDKSTASLTADNMKNIEDYEEWQQELIKELYDLEVNPQDYIKLPSYEDINERDMMIEFLELNSIKYDESMDEKQLKNLIEDKCIFDEWYDFREESEKKIAIKWCEDNHIEIK